MLDLRSLSVHFLPRVNETGELWKLSELQVSTGRSRVPLGGGKDRWKVQSIGWSQYGYVPRMKPGSNVSQEHLIDRLAGRCRRVSK